MIFQGPGIRAGAVRPGPVTTSPTNANGVSGASLTDLCARALGLGLSATNGTGEGREEEEEEL